MKGVANAQRTTTSTSAGNSVGCWYTQANGTGIELRRFKLYDLNVGSDATPADVAITWLVGRTNTAAPTGGSAANPNPLDAADAAMSTLGMQAGTGGVTAGVTLMEFALNQRATFRWVAAPGSELVVPATANNGLQFLTPELVGGTPSCWVQAYIDEQ
jgi:hypothetical protein